MAEQTFLAKLHEEFLKSDDAPPDASVFIQWAEKWLSAHPPIGTGFAEGTSALTIRFQDGSQYPLYANPENNFVRSSVQITGQAIKGGKSGIVASPSFPITGN